MTWTNTYSQRKKAILAAVDQAEMPVQLLEAITSPWASQPGCRGRHPRNYNSWNMEKAGGSTEAERSGSWSRLAVSVELEVGGQVIGKRVMLLGAFLGGAAEVLLVPLGPGTHDVDEQVSPSYDGDEAGVGAGA
jgi:hypothetical protein